MSDSSQRATTVIQPPAPLEAALTNHDFGASPSEVRVLGFPKHLLAFDVEIERKFLSNREVSLSVTVDALTGVCRKNDVYPDLDTRYLTPTSLLNPRVRAADARETAHTFVRRRINRWYKSFTTPSIEPTRTQQAFKLFWVVPTGPDTVTVVDSITRELTAENIRPDQLTERHTPRPESTSTN
ncbi:hypothetical protein G9464_03015 [Halostella sp. JP-L12]|uniref:hypothetical protein n=1 Tax=Halostella TaxID=1843185 RepID=UPI0013CE937E|nr:MULTISPECIES: hypothetical protein [Halostella]NHN46569.1 hypothetical protein [Halostella sp. JP-L12]